MTNIIELSKFKRNRDDHVWIADLSLFEDADSYSARINSASVDLELSDAEMLRKMADCLDTISFMARQEAEKYEESEKGAALAFISVFKDGSVRSRLDDELITTNEQFTWLADCLDLMSGAVRRGEV
jgi:hypothetical protein